MPDVRHILLTRFNLPIETFPVDRAGQPTRTEDWLEHRLRLFREACVHSIAAQTWQGFRWFILVDAAGAAALRARLDAILRGIDAVVVEAASASGWRAALRGLLSPLPDRLMVTRLDNDDALHPDHLRHARDLLMPHAEGRLDFPGLPLVLNFSHGMCWDGTQFHDQAYYHNAFTTWLVDRSTEDASGFAPLPYDVNHVKVHERHPVIDLRLAEPMWVQVVHGRNVSNRVRGAPAGVLSDATERAFGYLRGVAP